MVCGLETTALFRIGHEFNNQEMSLLSRVTFVTLSIFMYSENGI